ncbi:hypothetical protein CDD80_2522 [Ophiocordyceps camponoti-rufipedis]|uniref:Uncharacterized protein n=1 Tax=Ophiocordyceps camponoti-rufipedis TaxID=2004952 RepID=A0A2C5Z5W1_9HYPO|nr:hypothetical protein CDD80_2522 [Ophiocordyceps camponoti-rufipedis]
MKKVLAQGQVDSQREVSLTMPPTRTRKKNSSTSKAKHPFSKPSEPKAKAAPKGVKKAYFSTSACWDEGWQEKLGTRTKSISFGRLFDLTDQHVEQLTTLRPAVCSQLTHFLYNFGQTDLEPPTGNELNDAAATQLALMCPKLRVLRLKKADAARLTDAALISFFSNCPDLIEVDVSGPRTDCIVTEDSFDALLTHPDWAPQLKKFRIPAVPGHSRSHSWMRAMQALSRRRGRLVIALARWAEKKAYPEFSLAEICELVVAQWDDEYKNGTLQPSRSS